jgi:hypothetical protein
VAKKGIHQFLAGPAEGCQEAKCAAQHKDEPDQREAAAVEPHYDGRHQLDVLHH